MVEGKAQRRTVKEEDEAPQSKSAPGRGNSRGPKGSQAWPSASEKVKSGSELDRGGKMMSRQTGDRSHEELSRTVKSPEGVPYAEGSHCEL